MTGCDAITGAVVSRDRAKEHQIVPNGSASNERVLHEISLHSALDAASPSVISGEARVKMNMERVNPVKVLITTLTGVAISAALTFLAM